jgi:ribonuclease Y
VIGTALFLLGVVVAVFAQIRARSLAETAARELAAQRSSLEDSRREQTREIDARRKELDIEAKTAALTYRNEVDQEYKDKRAELTRGERRLIQKEDALDRRLAAAEDKEKQVALRQEEVDALRAAAASLVGQQRAELERIAGMTAQDAGDMLRRQVEDELRLETARLIRDRVDQAEHDAERKAREIIAQAVQRCAVDQVAATTVSVVPIPNDEMKGRIIGREGRNIRAFEGLTGVDLIIDDTPEAVVVSGFDPVRREVARVAMTALITDGRIHPGRIEEVILKSQQEVEQRMREAAEEALVAIGAPAVHEELVKLLGKLKFRTSYGQNVLSHSLECAHVAGIVAAELGLNVALAKRGALLHDIGKAVDFETEGHHAEIGVDLARRYGESEAVLNCIGAHHGDSDFTCMEAVIVQAADAISASRPGARRESLETYIKRLEGLERIADSFPGVEKAFAIQAGREIRVMVAPERVNDELAYSLARDMAKKIEEELQYPGQIRVTIIREVRAVEYAK